MIRHTYSIDIKSNTPLHSLGDGHIMVYDENDKCYYATTREQFLRTQNKRIDDIQNFYAVLETATKNRIKELQDSFDEFVSKVNANNKAFMETYKETNAVVLNMVKSFVENQQGETNK